MSLRVASAFAVLFAVGMVGVACSSSDSSGTTNPGSTCGGSSSGSGSPECGSCVQASCSSEYNTCFGGSGACVSWMNGGCKGSPPSDCTSCILGPLYSCQQSHCADKCKSSGTTDAGTGDTGSTAGACTTLAACCPSIDADAGGPDNCNMIASGGNDSACSSLLTGYKSLGYCK